MAEKQSIKRFIVRDPHGHIEHEDSFSVVGEVHVDVVPGYGEPYAESEYIDGVLTITIHNIEGNGITDITTDSQEGDEAINTVTIKTDDNPEGETLQVRNGSRGNGIASSSEVLSPEDGGINTHTIVDTDGNEHVFHTKNGRKGDKGDQGDSAVYDPSSPDAPDFVMANTTGQSTTKAMTQKAVTDELVPVKGFDESWQWKTGKKMHQATASVLDNVSTFETSYPLPVAEGDKVVVKTEDDGSNKFTVIAFLDTADAATWVKKVIETHPNSSYHEYECIVDSDGYVVVCGMIASMDAKIYKKNRLAENEDLKALEKRVSENEAILGGEKNFSIWTKGYLHVNNAQVYSSNTHIYSEYIALEKGDTVKAKVYRKGFTNYTAIAKKIADVVSPVVKISSSSGADQWYDVSYTAEEDGEEVRICGWVGENNEYPIESKILLANAVVKRKEVQELLESQSDNVPPSYWKEYLDERLSSFSMNSGKDAFLFITDPHFGNNNKKSAVIAGYIINNTGICKTICGGDICRTGSAADTYENLLINEIRELERLAEKTSKKGKFYAVRGNHDYYAYNGETKYRYEVGQVVEHMKGLTEKLGTSYANDQAMYYRFDNMEAKIRYIIMDCEHGSAGGVLRLGAEQVQWLADSIASTPSGYGIIVIGHAPCYVRMSESAEQRADYLHGIREILVAAKKKSQGSLAYTDLETTSPVNVNYDFTTLDADVLFYLNGHSHTDNQTYYEGVPYITCICDQKNQDPNSPFCESTEVNVTDKGSGTTKEQALNIVEIPEGKGMVNVLRIGIGFDRYFHIGKYSVSTGQTLDLSQLVEKVNPSTWMICDCDDVAYADGTWSYKSEVATIANGIVSGVASGEAIAFAEDDQHNKEFFHIEIL